MIREVTAACSVLLLLAGSASAAPLNCATLAAQMHRSKIPDLAVAVFSHGRVETIFCSSVTRALAPDSVFEAASLSKPVFAYGVLKLVQDHRLDLDRPLAEYLNRPYEHEQNPFRPDVTDETTDPRGSPTSQREWS